jgi:hypothetical protein
MDGVLVWGFASLDKSNDRGRRVREPELDMHRNGSSESTGGRFITWLKRLMPDNREVTGPPRRAIGRELEEAWPTNDR